MMVMLGVFWAAAMLELLLWLVPAAGARQVVSSLLAAPVVVASYGLFVDYPATLTLILLAMSGYRLVNFLRVIEARANERYLRRSALATSLWLIALQGALTLIWQFNLLSWLSEQQFWLITSYLAIVSSAILLCSTIRHLWTTRAPKLRADEIQDSRLPTLTVAIPARNETEDLEECLATLVASNYPKLEILVLDDCSQNKRTPEIIRSYAHSGVRFLQGTVPQENWLAKNQAYQQLANEANGELILFCGVDVRLTPNSLRMLVAALVHKQKSMISVIPRNTMPSLLSTHPTVMVQTMRYAWELSLPRRLFRRPPVLSTCWLIRREVLMQASGFAAVSRSIIPEAYFARVSAAHDGYGFMQSSDKMGIASQKSITEQEATAIRVQYPRVHRRIELVMLLGLAELGSLVLPYTLLILALVGLLPTLYIMPNAISVTLLTLGYALISLLTYRTWLARSLLILPAAAILDVVLLHYSMLRYEFFTVIWKDRNVCIPVMHVVPQTPAPEPIRR